MRAALEAGVERVVYTSSVATIKPHDDGTPADETRPLTPETAIGAYKRSKVVAERVVEEMVAREGLPAVIVNPSTPIGPRDVKPTPTGRIIVEAANGKMPAFVDTGLNLALSTTWRRAICWPCTGAASASATSWAARTCSCRACSPTSPASSGGSPRPCGCRGRRLSGGLRVRARRADHRQGAARDDRRHPDVALPHVLLRRQGAGRARYAAGPTATACPTPSPGSVRRDISDDNRYRGALRQGHPRRELSVASHLIHPRHRGPILDFYYYVRAGDDVADNAGLSPERKIALLDGLADALTAKGPDDPEAAPLRRSLAERGLPPRHALELLDAFRMDAHKTRYETWDELAH